MSGTDLAYGATIHYAMSGTDLAYGATTRYASPPPRPARVAAAPPSLAARTCHTQVLPAAELAAPCP
eukprot:967506-Rhodomonas_salina.1